MNTEHIQNAIDKANNLTSKLTPAILGMEGMSSPKVRHFLNNICDFERERERVNYLEIGVWRGSTFCSSIFNNNLNCAIAIDNFTEFEGCRIPNTNMIRQEIPIRDNFTYNVNQTLLWSNNKPNNTKFYDEDCFKIDLNKLLNFDIYLYDGGHKEEEQYNAFKYFNSKLNNTFIAIVDDWNYEAAQNGTKRAFDELGYKVIQEWIMPGDQSTLEKANKDWWNGYYIALINK